MSGMEGHVRLVRRDFLTQVAGNQTLCGIHLDAPLAAPSLKRRNCCGMPTLSCPLRVNRSILTARRLLAGVFTDRFSRTRSQDNARHFVSQNFNCTIWLEETLQPCIDLGVPDRSFMPCQIDHACLQRNRRPPMKLESGSNRSPSRTPIERCRALRGYEKSGSGSWTMLTNL